MCNKIRLTKKVHCDYHCDILTLYDMPNTVEQHNIDVSTEYYYE